MYRTDGQNNPLAPAALTFGTPQAVAAAPNPQPQQVAPHIQQVVPAAPQPQTVAVAQPIVPEPAATVAVQAPAQAPAPPAEPEATVDQLEAACPQAPADFVVQMIKQKATVAQALTAYIAYLEPLARQAKAMAAAPATAAAPPAPAYVPATSTGTAPAVLPVTQAAAPALPGNAPVAPEPAATVPAMATPEDAKAHYQQLVQSKFDLLTRQGYQPGDARREAYASVEQTHPGLREKAHNVVQAIPMVMAPAQPQGN